MIVFKPNGVIKMTFSSIATFWNEKHPLSKQANALYSQMVPMSGNSTSLQGELLRASSRISYDWFNNGWGNNWSGAVKFLENNFIKLPNQPEADIIKELKKELAFVLNYSHGEPCPSNNDYKSKVYSTVTKIHEIVVTAILANPDLINNTDDMFNYQEEEYQHSWEEEEY